MEKKHVYWLVAFVFLLTAGIRIFVALQTPHFSDDQAYFALRQIDEIKQNGTPLYNDDLSYGGRTYIFLPVFYYILAFFSLFFKTSLVAKILPNIFASTLVIVVFLIVRHMTRNDNIAILSSFVSGFIPIYFTETINSVSVLTASIPLTFLVIYFLIKGKSKIYHYLISLCLILFITPYSAILVISLLLYMLFSWVEGFRPKRSELELTLFSVFLVTWFNFLFYKDAFLAHGYKVIWQNIPTEVLNQFYTDVNILNTIYQIGIVPLISGIIVLYIYLVHKKKKSIYLLLSLAIIIIMLLIQKYLQLNVGLVYIGVVMTILLSELLVMSMEYLEKTKFARLQNYLLAVLFIIFLFTSFIPSVTFARQKVIESDPAVKVFGLEFIQDITDEGDTIIASVFEGHLINYVGQRKNVVDSNFLLVDAETRLRDIRTIYTSAIQAKPIEIMEKYDADFIVFTDEVKHYYNITKITYVDDECFPIVYSGTGVRIYERRC